MARGACWIACWMVVGMGLVGGWGRAEEPAAKAAAATSKAEAEVRRRADAEYYELYRIFADTLYQVEQNYVQEVDRRELMEAAIRGLLDKLDPYSNYISPAEMDRFKTNVESQFGGIGIQVTMDGGRLRVLSPLVGSPAYRAGVQAGDAIVAIDGKPTEGLKLDECVKRLKGEAGSSVSLTIVHAVGGQRETLTLTREIIHLETVLGDHRKPDSDSWDFMLDPQKKIGYIRLTAFSRETAGELGKALEELQKLKMRGLILDLRFNPGGLLKSATDIADLFISEGLIVSTKGRNTAPREVLAKKPGTFEGFPMAVLVNRFSASASEIVSACLQDHKRAIVVGERTWGKGSVQNVIDLEDGKSALKLTTASYWRPNGHNINRAEGAKESDEWGVMPDKGYELKLPDAELSDLVRDRQHRDLLLISHAPGVKHRAGGDGSSRTGEQARPAEQSQPAPDKDVPGGSKPSAPAPNPPKKGFVDRQLQLAIDYLSGELAQK